ncbi:hypothetical protein BKA70DRAFT_1294764 [Coprinopsis sp. MPI-PUGE-AT-0042]|nr:hypothetical protein BKA70DRAFT_1294764 [Coprinopsis sp. MPI-PUGE-AT-0042]
MKAIPFLFSLLLVSLSSPIAAAPVVLNKSLEWVKRELPFERRLERRFATAQEGEFLEARVEGQLATLTRQEKAKVIQHIKDHPDHIRQAALAADSAKSFNNGGDWRIDRQTPTRGEGKTQAKVAIQRNGASVGRADSVAASVAIVRNGKKDQGWTPSLKTVSKALIWSANSGRESTLTRPGADRQIAKAERIKAARDAGAAKAAKGNFRKGQVSNPASAKKFTKINNWKGNGLPKPSKGKRRK